MSLTINHNLLSANVARNLSSSYGALSTSTERLSSGLRVNSAADDAAGLAVREIMRAEIASLNQGVRNANDAISMIQTADGALGVIDEKLIRMKELAMQASTGTYSSDQRLIIDSEYQAMASEITRIANATDFNGIHLLNGNISGTSSSHNGAGLKATGPMKVHFGSSNDSSEDYYYVSINNSTASALGVGLAATGADGKSISTQQLAQKALAALDKAIISKDNIRANLGALQNR
ncbi:MAG: flagellin, partial [Humidesulfovibrio sp.]|uniref:flagellin N-terminal helical domain-containing protein n=1 Tax=Humidesulfovibrio sp. TaxID=2910988 RepID=UPI002736357E